MPYVKFLPETARMVDLLKSRPGSMKLALQLGQELLRSDSEFTNGERELLATYVSALNRNQYCLLAHASTAKELGIEESLLTTLIEDSEEMLLEEKFIPILSYIKKLTLCPSQITKADADAIFDVGWSDHALSDITFICAWENMMNRIIEGHGFQQDFPRSTFEETGKRLARDGYFATP